MRIGTCCLLVALALSSVLGMKLPQKKDDKCIPEVTCRLPECRCFDDPNKPGNVANDVTPQMILLAFSYSLNRHTIKPYLSLMEDLANPNNCPVTGTFFAEYLNTNTSTLAELHKAKHEVAITSADGKVPKSTKDWRESLFQSSEKLYDAGIHREDIHGVLSPQMYMGGDDEFDAMVDLDLHYEASCLMARNKQSANVDLETIWPFTYDYNPEKGIHCDMGAKPTKSYRDIWQFVQPEMTFKNHTCTSMSSCSPFIKTIGDSFTFFFDKFQAHYYNNRAPMVLLIDPEWMTVDLQVKGLKEFLKVASRFKHTWFITMRQGLEWIRSPVPMYENVKFIPWECDYKEKMAHKKFNFRK